MSVEGLGRTRGVVVLGVDGHVVEVEAHVYQGVVGFTVVGLADKAVGEARDRSRSALLNSGLPWPGLRVTIGLSPAWLPKRGPTLDLPVALALAVSQGALRPEVVADVVFVGELGLDGRIRPVRGALVAALAARDAGVGTLVVPAGNLREAELVPDLDVAGFHTLAGLVAQLRGDPPPEVELAAQRDDRASPAADAPAAAAGPAGRARAAGGAARPRAGRRGRAPRVPCRVRPGRQDHARRAAARAAAAAGRATRRWR